MHKPLLVLRDLLLSGTDALEPRERVPEMVDLLVNFISAYGRANTIAKALDAGAVAYLVKPFSPVDLTASGREALRRRASTEPSRLGDLAIG